MIANPSFEELKINKPNMVWSILSCKKHSELHFGQIIIIAYILKLY